MFTSEAELEARLTAPSQALIDDMAKSSGDLMILGAGGKMGPTMAVLARRAMNEAGRASDKVIAVSRWSDPRQAQILEDQGVEIVAADLLGDMDFAELPDADDVLFMVGAKFGSASQPSWAWAVNAVMPDRVARRYRDSRITTFSTGNVYPLVPVTSTGTTEESAVGPVGEYAMSCLGRERVFSHSALTRDTPVSIIRLNYAADLRYGVLYDIADPIMRGEPVDLTTGHVNVVWQGYANEVTLRSMAHASKDVFTLNLTGPEILSVEKIATRLAEGLGKEVTFTGEAGGPCLLSDASKCFDMFGYPDVSAGQLIDWQADWLARGLPTSGKPTKFAVRDGKF
ncbi:epimerase [Timonella senegalensis]|uniref:NAD-dependent epimerase/dehydratase family protein n=2 Tax=Timonella senegalensis TaxID=1465825 RepID=UPI002FDD272E